MQEQDNHPEITKVVRQVFAHLMPRLFKGTAITATDVYKIGHPAQYQNGTTRVVSNWTPRKSRIEGVNKVVFFSQQAFIKQFLMTEFDAWFKLDEDEAIRIFMRRIVNMMPPKSRISSDHVRALHRLQYLPICVMSLPEGSRSHIRVPQSVIFNTLPEFYWLTNHIETIYSCEVWKGATSATISAEYANIFDHYGLETVGNTDFSPIQAHDFSMRGMSGVFDAMASGAGHLLAARGTDTIPAIDYLEAYYNADCEKEYIGGSVFATEHAVMCSATGFYVWDDFNGDWSFLGKAELKVFKRLITEVYPDGIISIVSDTWDLWKVIVGYCHQLHDVIMARDGKLVIRPDSGNPVDILCGTYKNLEPNGYSWEEVGKGGYVKFKGKFHEAILVDGALMSWKEVANPHPSVKGVVELLHEEFGGTITDKGYKLLDPHIGTIYGDSITLHRAMEICERLKGNGFASINWVAGIGSYTYQYQTRDTFGFAMKATYCVTKGYEIEIFKDPITDDGTKKSARGMVAVYKDKDGEYYLKDGATLEEMMNCELKVVFRDSQLIKDWTLQEVRDNLAESRRLDKAKVAA